MNRDCRNLYEVTTSVSLYRWKFTGIRVPELANFFRRRPDQPQTSANGLQPL